METANLADGCSWCTEAIFKRLNGIKTVELGYSGGKVENPRTVIIQLDKFVSLSG